MNVSTTIVLVLVGLMVLAVGGAALYGWLWWRNRRRYAVQEAQSRKSHELALRKAAQAADTNHQDKDIRERRSRAKTVLEREARRRSAADGLRALGLRLHKRRDPSPPS